MKGISRGIGLDWDGSGGSGGGGASRLAPEDSDTQGRAPAVSGLGDDDVAGAAASAAGVESIADGICRQEGARFHDPDGVERPTASGVPAPWLGSDP